MKILSIDPGNTESSWLLYDADAGRPETWANKADNEDVLGVLMQYRFTAPPMLLAVEMVASYGMPVGREVFDTCVWIGRFIERWDGEYRRVYRKEVKYHLTNSIKSKDPHVRQALLDKFGPGKDLAVGKKASPGPLYGLSGDGWASLGVAVTAAETEKP